MAQLLIPVIFYRSVAFTFLKLSHLCVCPPAQLLVPSPLILFVFSSFGDMLSFTLTAFVELMDHGIVSWDTFSVAFIKKVM